MANRNTEPDELEDTVELTDDVVTDDAPTDDVVSAVVVDEHGNELVANPAPFGSTDMVPIDDDDLATVEAAILNMQTLAVDDSETIAVRLAAKKLRASNVDELNSLGELGSIEDVLHVPMLVSDLHWNESRIAGSRGAYAVFDAVHSYTGERRTFGTGHMDVMITLYKASQWGLLPVRMLFEPAKNPNRFGKPTYLATILPPEGDT